jgi:exosortase
VRDDAHFTDRGQLDPDSLVDRAIIARRNWAHELVGEEMVEIRVNSPTWDSSHQEAFRTLSERSVMKPAPKKRNEWTRPLVLVLLGGCLFWALWPVLGAMNERWANDPRYAHGYLVPVFSLALLWLRRDRLRGDDVRPSAWGLAFLGLGAALHIIGGLVHHDSVAGLALLPYLAGVCLLVGGWRALDWAWLSIAFLVFMIPLPFTVENALGPPLQYLATTASTYLLQTLGFMAFADGYVIQLDDARIGVVEACSGLSMIMTFIALSTAAALIVKRPLLDRLVLVASSIPVALIANIIRITATGILHDKVGGHAADTFYHDLAGWLMIPLALGLYWLEIWVISHILVESTLAVPALDLGASRAPARGNPIGAKG